MERRIYLNFTLSALIYMNNFIKMSTILCDLMYWDVNVDIMKKSNLILATSGFRAMLTIFFPLFTNVVFGNH